MKNCFAQSPVDVFCGFFAYMRFGVFEFSENQWERKIREIAKEKSK